MAAPDINLQEVHDVLVKVAYEAGKMIMAANPSDIAAGTKLNCRSTQRPYQGLPFPSTAT
jgi:hypothetical protein